MTKMKDVSPCSQSTDRKVSKIKIIYKMFIRSIMENSAVVWHSSLSENNRNDLERVQKSAVKIILDEKELDYDEALSKLNLDRLDKRREKFCLSFAKKCLKIEKVKTLFPMNDSERIHETRNFEKFKVNHFYTERYKRSAIPFLQNLLNKGEKQKKKFLRSRGS